MTEPEYTDEQIDSMLLDALIDETKEQRPMQCGGVIEESAMRLVARGHAERDPNGKPWFRATPDGFNAMGRLGEWTWPVPDDMLAAMKLAQRKGSKMGEAVAAVRSLRFVEAICRGDIAEATQMQFHVKFFAAMKV